MTNTEPAFETNVLVIMVVYFKCLRDRMIENIRINGP